MEQIRDLLSAESKKLEVKSGPGGNFVPGLVARQVRARAQGFRAIRAPWLNHRVRFFRVYQTFRPETLSPINSRQHRAPPHPARWSSLVKT